MTRDEKIAAIAKRAAQIAGCDALTFIIDLSYCIEGGCSLRLDDMMKADDFNLMHDIYGINKNLNHETFKLENCFLPRFAGSR